MGEDVLNAEPIPETGNNLHVEDSAPGVEEKQTEPESGIDTDKKELDKSESEEEKPHKDRFQKRINQLTSKNKMLQQRLEALERSNFAPPSQGSAKPERVEYPNEESFIDALTDYKLQKRIPEVQKQIAENKNTTESHKSFLAKEEQVRSQIEDYDEAIEDAAHIPVQASVADAIISSDLGPQLRYYLATHVKQAEALNNMSAGAAAREIGKIESVLEAERVKKTSVKKVSNAPPPVKPVNSGGDASGIIDINDPKMPMNDWIKKRQEQRAKARAPLKRIT
jgi:DNA-binding HxlR family transcriptional regulator